MPYVDAVSSVLAEAKLVSSSLATSSACSACPACCGDSGSSGGVVSSTGGVNVSTTSHSGSSSTSAKYGNCSLIDCVRRGFGALLLRRSSACCRLAILSNSSYAASVFSKANASSDTVAGVPKQDARGVHTVLGDPPAVYTDAGRLRVLMVDGTGDAVRSTNSGGTARSSCCMASWARAISSEELPLPDLVRSAATAPFLVA